MSDVVTTLLLFGLVAVFGYTGYRLLTRYGCWLDIHPLEFAGDKGAHRYYRCRCGEERAAVQLFSSIVGPTDKEWLFGETDDLYRRTSPRPPQTARLTSRTHSSPPNWQADLDWWDR